MDKLSRQSNAERYRACTKQPVSEQRLLVPAGCETAVDGRKDAVEGGASGPVREVRPLVEGSHMTAFLRKFKGDGAHLPPPATGKAVAFAWLGGFLAIASVAALADVLSVALVLGSFGASCVLVFGYPDVPFSQPRNVIAGHVISSLVGLTFLTALGPHWWSVALAVGTAIALMMLTRTVHPPAGSNPVIVFLAQPTWSFLLFPTLSGALILVAVALAYNNATRDARYPKYW
jgi:CBS-domain-containing membrane protein